MSAHADRPIRYRVIYSERVRAELKELLSRSVFRGMGSHALEAVKTIDSRLHIYPQFGQPLRDLKTEGSTLWIAVVWPLVVQYVLDEERRLVFVLAPFQMLPHTAG